MEISILSESNTDNNIINELLPMFGNNQQQVESFLHSIEGADDTMITNTVKNLVSQGIINEYACKTPLFYILKNYDIYHAGLSTWNKQV